MQIKSNFKDYYDHVSHIYGGGDPKCLYVRTRVAEREVRFGTLYAGSLDIKQQDIVKLPAIDYHRITYSFKWLAVCGKYFLLIANQAAVYNPDWDIYTPEKYPDVATAISGRWSGQQAVVDAIGNFSVPLLELSRKVNAPVFTFDSNYRSDVITVDGEIPVLGNLGFASIIDAQQIYQELSYFVGNVIKTSPDLAPVSMMTNNEKISQYGFDVRKSFRHRV